MSDLSNYQLSRNFDLLQPIVSDPVIEAYKPGIDVSLIRENLLLSTEDRIRSLMNLAKVTEELRTAMKTTLNW